MVFRAYCGQLLQLLVTLFSFWVVTLTGCDPLFFWGYGGVGVKKLSRGWGLFKTFLQARWVGGAEEAERAEKTDYTKLGLIWKISEKCGEKGMVPDFFADSKIFDRRDAEQNFYFCQSAPAVALDPPASARQ